MPAGPAAVSSQTINPNNPRGWDPAVWNLLYFDQEENYVSYVLAAPTTLAGARASADVTVTQFGSPSSGYWVMVECPLSNPTSFATNLALQVIVSSFYFNVINFWYIQDTENLHVGGFF